MSVEVIEAIRFETQPLFIGQMQNSGKARVVRQGAPLVPLRILDAVLERRDLVNFCWLGIGVVFVLAVVHGLFVLVGFKLFSSAASAQNPV